MRAPITRREVIALLLMAAATTPVAAQQRTDNAAELQRVEHYLNSIRTLRARFLQVASNGGTAEGTILIKRPGKLKLDYTAPTRQMVITTSNFIAYVDKDGRTSYQDLSSSLAGILIRPQIRLSGDIRVTDVSRAPGVVRTRLALAKEPDAGSITLVFSDDPLELRQWVVVDPTGNSVEVTLQNAQFGVPIADKEFEFIDPNSPVAKELQQQRR